MFEYRNLGNYTYNIITDSEKITPLLREWLSEEWETDKKEHPQQSWTNEWLDILKKQEFELRIMPLSDIVLRDDLMNTKEGDWSFEDELKERVLDREESMKRGVSIEPLIVNNSNMELMDGYTRYTALKEKGEKEAYVYITK